MGAASAVEGGRDVPKAFYGMHDGDPATWPSTSVGSLRLWDSGTSWRETERSPGRFDWSRLDAYVAEARRRGARVTVVLGQTPAFHVRADWVPSGLPEYYGTGATGVPRMAAWRAYVRRVAVRYAGRVEALQVWNEPNVRGFWSGTPRQMALLTYWAAHEVRRVERERGERLDLVAPSFVARSNTWAMDRYWAQQVHGRRMTDLVDAAALSLYPPRDLPPEAAMRLLRQLRRTILERRHVDLPLWITEINYGIAPGGPDGQPPLLSRELQAAYVLRTLVLAAGEDQVQRVFWYAWDQIGVASVVTSRHGEPTVAGRAFARAQRWLAWGPLRGCRRSAAGVTVCRLADARRSAVVWRRGDPGLLRVAAGTTVRDLRGRATTYRSTTDVVLDGRPLLVRPPRRNS